MFYILIYFVVFIIWVGIELFIAPRGYEDENGFHFGNPKKDQKEGNILNNMGGFPKVTYDN